jgi:hypothetical protein
VFFKQHGEEHDFEGQGVGGVAGGGEVLPGVGEQIVERLLVAAAQAAAEVFEVGFFLEEGLGEGCDGSAYGRFLSGGAGK